MSSPCPIKMWLATPLLSTRPFPIFSASLADESCWPLEPPIVLRALAPSAPVVWPPASPSEPPALDDPSAPFSCHPKPCSPLSLMFLSLAWLSKKALSASGSPSKLAQALATASSLASLAPSPSDA